MAKRLAGEGHSTTLQWMAILILFLGSACLGFWGFQTAYPPTGPIGSDSWWLGAFDNLYRVLTLFTVNATAPDTHANWAVQIARFSAPAATLSALAKILIAAAYSQALLNRLRKTKNHNVIIGLTDMGIALLKQLVAEGEKVIAITHHTNEELEALCKFYKVPLLVGDASEWPVLEDAAVQKAAHLFLTDDEDGDNIEIAVQAAQLKKQSGSREKLTLHIHLGDPEMNLRLAEFERSLESLANQRLGINFFSSNTIAARQVMAKAPLASLAYTALQPRVHLALVGWTALSEAVLLETLLSGQHPSLKGPRITVLIPENSRDAEAFYTRYPSLGEGVDIRFLKTADNEILDAIKSAELDTPITATLVSTGVQQKDKSLALHIMAEARKGLLRPGHVMIRDDSGSGLFSLLGEEAPTLLSASPFTFGPAEGKALLSAIRGDGDQLASAIHHAYAVKYQDSKASANALWADLAESYRRSNRRAADHIPVKLRAAGFSIPANSYSFGLPHETDFLKDSSEQEKQARAEHDRWMMDRLIDGWRYGEVRNNAARIHPMLIPFDKLREEEKQKDLEQVLFIKDLLVTMGKAGAPLLKRAFRVGVLISNTAHPDDGKLRTLAAEIEKQAQGKHLVLAIRVVSETEAKTAFSLLKYLSHPHSLEVYSDMPNAAGFIAEQEGKKNPVHTLWMQAASVIDLTRTGEKADMAHERLISALTSRCDSLIILGDETDPVARRLRRGNKPVIG